MIILSFYAKFQGKDITRYSMTSYSKGSKFYSLIFYLGYQTDKCGDITTSCIIGKNEFTILEIVNEVKNCKRKFYLDVFIRKDVLIFLVMTVEYLVV